jgi:hypothetical protein
MDKVSKRARMKSGHRNKELLKGTHFADQTGLSADDYLLWWERLQQDKLYQEIASELRVNPSHMSFGRDEVHSVVLLLLKWLREPPKSLKVNQNMVDKLKALKTSGGDKSLKEYHHVTFAHQIVNTLEFLRLFAEHFIEGDATIQAEVAELLKLCEAGRKNSGDLLSRAFVVECLNNLQTSNMDFKHHIIACSYVHPNELDNVFNIDERDLPPFIAFTTAGDTPFCFRYMRHCMERHPDFLPSYGEMLETARVLLLPKHIPGQLKSLPAVAKSTFLALLHMLTVFLTHWPISNLEYLVSLHDVVDTYTRWSVPYCNVALDFRAFLRTEAESPGAAFRRHVLCEQPILRLPPALVHSFLASGDIERVNQLRLWHEYGNTTSVFYDSDLLPGHGKCPPSIYAFLMRLDPLKPGPENATFDTRGNTSLLQRAQRSMIVQIVSTYFDEVSDASLGLDKLDHTQLSKAVSGMLMLVETTLKPIEVYHGHGIPSWSVDDVAAVTNVRAEAVGTFVARYINKEAVLHRKEEAFLGADKPDYPSQGGSHVLCHGFPSQYDGVSSSNVVHRLDWSRGSNFSFREYRRKLRTLFRVAACPVIQDKSNSVKSQLKIALLGGTLTVHRFLSAYVGLVEEAPLEKYLQHVELRLYLLPVGESDIAAHIAAKDPWYRRQVYSPFQHMHDALLPSLDVNMPLEQFIRNWKIQVRPGLHTCLNSPPPMLLARNLLEDYVQGAHETHNVGVYECLCWCPSSMETDDEICWKFDVAPRVFDEGERRVKNAAVDPQGSSAHMSLSFFNRVEVGLNVAVHEHREELATMGTASPGSPIKPRGEGDDPCSWRNILKSKEFRTKWSKAPGIDIDISLRETDIFGNTNNISKQFTRPTMPYANICVSTTSAYKGDVDVGRDPCVPDCFETRINGACLGFSATPLKGRVTELMKRREFNSKETEELCALLNGQEECADEEHYTCSHSVGYIELFQHVTKNDEGFKILVDGIVYGPFVKVIIRPKEGVAGKQMQLPFMHFLKQKDW